jgi:large subunit ribosomal protein L18
MASLTSRERRKLRIRNRVSGTAERPRLSVFRSARHIYAQVIDDDKGVTIAAASTLSADVRGSLNNVKKTEAAKKVGALIAQICCARHIEKIVFDRNGRLYHGRVKALAEAARQAGLRF